MNIKKRKKLVVMKNDKKICFFSAQYLPHVGGVERYTYNLAKALTKRGLEVTVVTSNPCGLPETELQKGIKIVRLPSYNLMGGRFPVIRLNKDFIRLYKKLKKNKYDLVITNTRFYTLSLLGTFYGKKHGKKNILIEHGTTHLSLNHKVLDFFERIFEHGITILDRLFCKNFYGVSNECNGWLKHFGIRSKGVLYNAIDIESVKKIMEKKVNIYEEYDLPAEAKIITFVGRMIKEKGVFELLDAFNQLQKEYHSLYLFMLGDGPFLEEIRGREAKNVICLGNTDYAKVLRILNASDIFCLPSYSEGMPTSVMEAIAAKTFVVTTQKGGAKEIITGRDMGYIIEKSDPAQIKKALSFALDHDTYREKAIELSYKNLLDHFTWDKVADKVLEIVEE